MLSLKAYLRNLETAEEVVNAVISDAVDISEPAKDLVFGGIALYRDVVKMLLSLGEDETGIATAVILSEIRKKKSLKDLS
jgi:hypothetical protein